MKEQAFLFINVFILVTNSDLIEVLANHYDFKYPDALYIPPVKHL